MSTHLRAVLQALLVTALWSSSWVIIKFSLAEIPALTFAGLRYSLAFLCLLPFILCHSHITTLRAVPARSRLNLVLLGLLTGITQGAQFMGLALLPAVSVSLMLNFTTIIVAIASIVTQVEQPTKLQWIGIVLFLVGILAYFYPVDLPAGQVLGLTVMAVGVLANAASSILGRRINAAGNVPPVVVTTISMGVGAAVLLTSGISIQGLPELSVNSWLAIIWLAVVNTAIAFTLWNHTLRTLSAVESSIINNMMLIQIALLAWLFLGEGLTWQEGAGMLVAGLGVLVVQLRWRTAGKNAASKSA